MGKAHNKKRNTGLLYEFLVRAISQALVDGDQRRSGSLLRIVKKHFKPGTELYKEYRLINSLVRTTVSNPSVASSIMQEAKAAARSYDARELDREKSLLISSINRTVNDPDFYDQPVAEYRTYATVQTLLNDWRDPNRDLQRQATYEDQLVSWLIAEKRETDDASVTDDVGEGRLLMKVMMRKLNEKYAGMLTDEQRQLLRAYAFSAASDDSSSIRLKLDEIRDRLLREIDSQCDTDRSTGYLRDKLVEAREMIASEDIGSQIDDETVTRFMLYVRLSSELTQEMT